MNHRPPSPDQALTFAVVSGSPSAERLLASLCEELSRAVSREVRAKVLPSYAALLEEAGRGGADLAWAPPLVAIDLERADLASLALCCSRSGLTGYHAALFTRHGSPIDKLADLRGAHVAWVDHHSSAGYRVPRMRLASAGLDPSTLFGKESFLGTHERVSIAVLAGEVDVGATYLSLDPVTREPLSAGWLEAGAGLNGAYVITTAGPIPADAIVLSNRLSATEKIALTAAVFDLPRTAPGPVSGLFRADGFEPPLAAHFDELRAMSAAFEALPAAARSKT